MFVVVKSKRGDLLRFLAIRAVVYPFFAFIYVRLLLKFLIIETPWMFIALMALLIVYIGSVIVIALKSAGGPSAVWMIVAGVTVFQLFPLLLRYIPMQWLSFPDVPHTLYYDDPIYWQLEFKMAVQSGIYGIPLGLMLGMFFEMLNRTKRPATLA